jgi:superoxide dismutase, Fe-Mn family
MNLNRDETIAKVADPGRLPHARVMDVRRAAAFEQATTMLPNATWRDPERVNEWAGELRAGQEVIVYCVHGHEVGRNTAAALQARGVNASFLAGGIEGWKDAGNAVVAKVKVQS